MSMLQEAPPYKKNLSVDIAKSFDFKTKRLRMLLCSCPHLDLLLVFILGKTWREEVYERFKSGGLHVFILSFDRQGFLSLGFPCMGFDV